jgi:hypothetical protein
MFLRFVITLSLLMRSFPFSLLRSKTLPNLKLLLFSTEANNELSVVQLRKKIKELGGIPGKQKKEELYQMYNQLLNEINDEVRPKASSTIPIMSVEAFNFLPNLAMKPRIQTKEQSEKLIKDLIDNSTVEKNENGIVTEEQFIDKQPVHNNSQQQQLRKTRFPVGNLRNERFDQNVNSELELSFLGTASCIPTATRGVSCMALRVLSDIWLFDCGESSQIQLQRSRIRPSKIKRIFITHSHGDHCFGLPGVLCMLGQSAQENRESSLHDADSDVIVDIYGPEGLRDYLRAAMQLTYSRITVPYRVHELKNVPYLHSHWMKRGPNKPR